MNARETRLESECSYPPFTPFAPIDCRMAPHDKRFQFSPCWQMLLQPYRSKDHGNPLTATSYEATLPEPSEANALATCLHMGPQSAMAVQGLCSSNAPRTPSHGLSLDIHARPNPFMWAARQCPRACLLLIDKDVSRHIRLSIY